MLKTLTIVYREGLAEGTYYSPIFRFLAALRIMFFPNSIIRFNSMKLMTNCIIQRGSTILCIFWSITIMFLNNSRCGSECKSR